MSFLRKRSIQISTRFYLDAFVWLCFCYCIVYVPYTLFLNFVITANVEKSSNHLFPHATEMLVCLDERNSIISEIIDIDTR